MSTINQNQIVNHKKGFHQTKNQQKKVKDQKVKINIMIIKIMRKLKNLI